MTLPNFLIIGAIKGGTTSLHHYLDAHPQTFMSARKEARYFCYDERLAPDHGNNALSIHHRVDYENLFANTGDALAIGESSPQYLCSEVAPARIFATLPNVKLIVSLRNPVERAFSAYMHHVREGAETDDFATALRNEPSRAAEGSGPLWHYVGEGRYSAGLRRYFDLFRDDQVKVILYDELTRDPSAVVRAVCEFLEIDPALSAAVTIRHNVSGVPRSRALHTFLTRNNPLTSAIVRLTPDKFRRRLKRRVMQRNLERAEIPPVQRAELIEVFRDEILRLEDLIKSDLQSWLVVDAE